MQTDNKLFEDFSKVATAAMGTLAGATREFSDVARERMKEFVGAAEISRDEFEAVKASAAAAREAVEQLRAEVAALKAELAAAAPAAEPARTRKSGGKSA
ncbi:accessory factor UbiK family protein [Sandarakinorhabdus rubra]|uniref:accessory factor UbiK family protein n=1 Tax=Sandarakinorhabdus rubra TaxID=2672568 RepID=UPI0013DB78F8|nr:accessory factor UbiK family protein [Sandarakinorhabdus rubra]